VSVGPPSILRTSSFRLTLLYAALFGISVLNLLGVIYIATRAYMSNSLDAAVDRDITELVDNLQVGGNETLAEEVKERVRQAPNGPMYYLLQDREGRILAGNIPPFHGGEGRFDLKVPRPNSPSAAVHARGITLTDRGYLMVGVDALPRRQMQKLILRVFAWTSVITLVLAFTGGALMSGGLLRRVETISRAARTLWPATSPDGSPPRQSGRSICRPDPSPSIETARRRRAAHRG
jgi:hypothetical protein